MERIVSDIKKIKLIGKRNIVSFGYRLISQENCIDTNTEL
jgi:hypothetical protein